MTDLIKEDITNNLTGIITPMQIANYYNLKWRTALVLLLVLTFQHKLKFEGKGFSGI